MKEHYFHEEEDFHGRDRKKHRKERRHAQETDRSKFKKSDLKREEPSVAPEDPSLRSGRVIAIGGEGIWVNVEGTEWICSLKGLIKKEKMQAKNLIAVGDLVKLLPSSEKEGSIVYINERYSFLSRTDVSGKQEQLIAVNIDQVLITSSVVQPPLKPALIDRYLIATEKGNMHPVILINKIDLLDTASDKEKSFYADFLFAYERLGYPILSISAEKGIGIEPLRALMQNKASAFSGQSGVGKSSLLNAAFSFDLATGGLTQKTSKGAHTTSSAELLVLPQGGFCIDTPGIRSFGVWKLQKEDLVHHFREFEAFAPHCRYPDCTHLTEPSCAVQKALVEKKIAAIRFESYRSLFEELEGLDHRTKRKLETS